MEVYLFINSLLETHGQPHTRLLTLGQLNELFSFSWIIHALFWLAFSHFCEGNLTNPVNVYAFIYQQLQAMFSDHDWRFHISKN